MNNIFKSARNGQNVLPLVEISIESVEHASHDSVDDGELAVARRACHGGVAGIRRRGILGRPVNLSGLWVEAHGVERVEEMIDTPNVGRASISFDHLGHNVARCGVNDTLPRDGGHGKTEGGNIK